MFLMRKTISSEAVQSMVAAGALPFVSKCVTNNVKDLSNVHSSLGTILHLKLVEVINSDATLYGESVESDKILVLVKAKSTSSVSVEIRSSNQALGSNLIKEVKAIFK
jgi:hypothetical protein